jgi:hypothetical protein
MFPVTMAGISVSHTSMPRDDVAMTDGHRPSTDADDEDGPVINADADADAANNPCAHCDDADDGADTLCSYHHHTASYFSLLPS